MRGTKHQIHDIRMPSHDLRQGLDRVLNSLSRPYETEGKKHLASLHTELFLAESRFHKVEIRDAVRNDIHLLIGDPVGFLQDLPPLAGHHDETTATRQQRIHHPALRGIGIAEDRMKGRDHRHPNLLQQGQ